MKLVPVAVILSLLLLLTGDLWAKEKDKAVEVTFQVRPVPFRVYLVTLEKPAEYLETRDGRGVVIVPSAFVENDRALKVRFSVPTWRGEYPDWKSIEDENVRRKLDSSGFCLTVPYASLKGSHATLPVSGEFHQLELPWSIRWQAWSYAHPGQGGLALTLVLGSVFLLVRYIKSRRNLVPALPTSQRVGPYTLKEVLGEGGMATVFRGVSSESGDTAAVKILKVAAETPQADARFLREVQTLLKLKHPNLMQVYDWGETEQRRAYIVCELLEGESLAQRLADGRKLGMGEIQKLLRPIAEALDYIHKNGLVHRDVKPGNIFCCSDGRVKLLDFGIARGIDLASITQTGQVMGTPRYMSPEQVKGDIHPATDQYALGLIVLELLTGCKLFQDLEPMAILSRHARGEIPSLTSLAPNSSPMAEAVLRRMTSLHPDNRFPTIVEAIEGLSGSYFGAGGDDTVENQSL